MTKETININPNDLPKYRDKHRVALISKKKGAHTDKKKQSDKDKCRQKVDEND